MSWPTVRLSDGIADVIRGVTFSRRDVLNGPAQDAIPVLRAGNISDRLVTDSDLVWIPTSRVADSQHLRVGDVIVCTSSGSRRIVGKTAINDTDFTGTWGAFNAVLRTSAAMDSRFLFYWTQSSGFLAWRDRQATGANIQNIRHSALASIEVPVPPSSEQRRIVEILDKADALRKRARDADSKVARILSALFLKMFGDPATNPMGWRVGYLSEFLDPVERRNPALRPDATFIYIDIAGVDGSIGRISATRQVLGSEAPSRARQIVQTYDTLVSTVRPYLRATALVPEELNGQIASTGFCVLRPRSSTGYAWLFQLTRQRWFTEQLNVRAKGASYPAVKDTDIMQLPVPIPSDAKRMGQFDALFERLVSKLDQARTASEASERLFDALLQRAFSGQLTAKWRGAHMRELQAEMREQARLLNLPVPDVVEAQA